MASASKSTAPRRKRVPGEQNRGVYVRPDGRFEVGYLDSMKRQRWEGSFATRTEARAARTKLVGASAMGTLVEPSRFRFVDVADRWLAQQVANLGQKTQTTYESHLRLHLRPRWARLKLDEITVEHGAALVRDLRKEGMSEWTIAAICRVANRIFKFARRYLGWPGTNPLELMDRSERARPSFAVERPIFTDETLRATIAATSEQWRLLFALAATTGLRMSEVVGLQWQDLDLADKNEATMQVRRQADTHGRRVQLKTESSWRTLELPASLAISLLAHRLHSSYSTPTSFVFSTRTGRAHSQRNVTRALRAAMRDAVVEGEPAFPALHERDEDQRPVKPPKGSLPTFHGMRHTLASESILAGETAEEVAWQLGHRNANVTRAVYIREVRSAEAKAIRRDRAGERYGKLMERASSGVSQ